MEDSSSGRIHGTLFESSGASLAADPAALTRGATLARYLLVEQVGVGGMGVVWAAYDPELDRKVAIKLLRPRAVRGPQTLAQTRLIREAQVMARLSHPNVIAIHDVGEHAGHVFLAMEFVQGKTLGRWVRATRRDWTEVVSVFVQAGRGLAEAHRVGLVHRDFKPANVLVDADGRARVTDFGLARAIGSQAPADPPPDVSALDSIASSLTRTGSLLGTPAYMAPEQFDGVQFDARGDQFGFCVALWEAVYGRRPFAGQTLAALSDAVHRHAIEPPPSEARIPDAIERALRRGLAVDPAERWPSMDALLEELARELARDPGIRRRRWWIGGGLLTSFVAALVIGPALFDASRPDAEHCPAITDLWDPQRRAALGLVHTESGRLTPERWARIADALDHYAQAYTAARALGCEPGARARCLDERRSALAVTLRLFEAGDPAVLDGADALLDVLPPIDACESARYLARFSADSTDPARERRLERLRARLLTARAEAAGGEHERAAEALRELAATARVEPSVWIAATIELGELERQAGAPERAREQLERAVAEAIRAGEDELGSRAAVLLIDVVGLDLGEPELGLGWARVAEAWHDRIGAPALARAQRSVAEGRLRRSFGQLDAASRVQVATLALLGVGEHALGPAQVDVAIGRVAAEAMRELAALARTGAQPSSARVWLEAAATLASSSLIAEERQVIELALELAQLDVELGDWAVAERRSSDALGLARACESCPGAVAVVALELARHRVRRAALGLESIDAAAAELERWVGLSDPLPPALIQPIALERARIARLQGRFAAAALVLAELDGPSVGEFAVAVALERGELWLAQDRPELALAEFERAATTYGFTRGSTHAEALAGRGRALAQLGRTELATAELERALAIWDALAPAGHPRAIPTLEQLADLGNDQGNDQGGDRGDPDSDHRSRAAAIRDDLLTSPTPRAAPAP